MIESFGVPQTDIAFWAGLTSAIFSFSQCLTAVPWGRLSDAYGRKPIILAGLTCTMISSLLWGFSPTLPMAIVARALQGATNGNVGIIRTMVAEMCPWKELQPRAFSVMPLVWNLGSVLGPAFGGALSNPYKKSPGDESSGPLLWRFPYALPNIVSACFFLVGILTGFFFLDETLASRTGYRDYGRRLGLKMTNGLSRAVKESRNIWRRARLRETEPLLTGGQAHKSPRDEETRVSTTRPQSREKQAAPGIREVLTRQTTLNLVVYTFLAMHAVAFDQLLPVFLHYPRAGTDVVRSEPPFRFNRGFGLQSGRIGLFFTLYGAVSIFYQFVIFPPLARRYGVLKCLRVVLVVFPIVYFFIPFTSLIDDVHTAQIALFALWLVKGLCTTFAFPCTTILLTNSATSIAALATVNGIATSVSAVGRGAGPIIAGSIFTWGVKEGYIIAPFWILTLISTLGAAAAWLLVECDGFGDDSVADTPSEIDSEGEEEVLFKPKVAAEPDEPDTEPDDEEADNITPLLSREWTRASSAASQAVTDTEDEMLPHVAPIVGCHPGGSHHRRSRRASASASASTQQRSGALQRRSSIPIGMGSGFRRLSSNLGQSRSGYGSGGGLAG